MSPDVVTKCRCADSPLAARGSLLAIQSRPVATASCLLQIVLLHVIAERPEAHAQELGGLDLDAAGSLERLRNVLAFDVLDVLLEVEAIVGKFSVGAVVPAVAAAAPRTCSGRLSTRIEGVRSSATARSIAFSNSRMFPGQP